MSDENKKLKLSALFWENGYIIIFISLVKSNINSKISLKRMLYGQGYYTDRDNINWQPHCERLF